MIFRGDPNDFVAMQTLVDWAEVTSTSRCIVLKFKSPAGYRRLFETMHEVDEDLWPKAQKWHVAVEPGSKVGNLRPALHIPYTAVPAVVECLRQTAQPAAPRQGSQKETRTSKDTR